jgi:hypothetical protein
VSQIQIFQSVIQQIGLIAPGFLSRVILIPATSTPVHSFEVTESGGNLLATEKNGMLYLYLDHTNGKCVPAVFKELRGRKIDVISFTVEPGRIVGYVQPPADIDNLFRPALLASGFESLPCPAGIYHFGRKGDGEKLQVVLRTSKIGGTTLLMYGSESKKKQNAVLDAMQAVLPHPQVAVAPTNEGEATPSTMAARALTALARPDIHPAAGSPRAPGTPSASTRSHTRSGLK